MDTNTYSTKDLAEMFGLSHQAIKVYARKFAEFLSPTATPEIGAKRVYTDDDIRVFALVRQYTKRGANFSDVHMALRAGQRGSIPDVAISAPSLVLSLRDEIDRLNQRVIEAKAIGDSANGKVELLQQQLADKEQLIRQLYEENALLKARQKK